MSQEPVSAVIILAAGYGTRMRSKRAKVLHEAGGLTLLNNVIRAASAVAPPERIICVIGHQAEQVRASVSTSGVQFAIQSQQLGTGHAVQSAQSLAAKHKGPLLILNGDGPLLKPETLQGLIAAGGAAKAQNAIVTTELQDATGYGRIIRDGKGFIKAVVEQKALAADEHHIREINPGVYCFDSEPFWQYIGELTQANAAREFYLTDMLGILYGHSYPVMPYPVEDSSQLLGINTRVELAVADRILRTRKAERLMLSGVTIEQPETVTIDADVTVEPDTIIESHVQLRGNCVIGSDCRIGVGSVLSTCSVANGVTIRPYVVAEDAIFGPGAKVGPFSRLRMNAVAGENTQIGNFVELKNAVLGPGSKANHLAYLGDSTLGTKVNIGAGTITCNYDGIEKHRTSIADGAFVGSNSTLVAPVTIGEGAYVAAGSVITHEVSEGSLAIGRAMQVDKPEWARKRKARARS